MTQHRKALSDLLRPRLKDPGFNDPSFMRAYNAWFAAAGVPEDVEPGPGLVGAAGTLEKPAERVSGDKGARTTLTDPPAFYGGLRGSVAAGGMTQRQVDGIEVLLIACGAAGWPIAYTAYALATSWWETARTMQPIKEHGGASYFHRMYDIAGARPHKARELGNLSPGDGAKFAGRGYVQLTGKSNYAKASAAVGVDLVADPDAAMRADIASKILIWGMSTGAFTGKKLSDYLPVAGPANHRQFVLARYIINGQDKASQIADIAIGFQTALQRGGWK